MADDKMKILQRLEDGEITADEALAMMNQIGKAAPPRDHGQGQHQERQQQNQGNQPQGSTSDDWLGDVVGWVGDLVGDIAGGIRDMDVPGHVSDFLSGTYGHNRRTETFVSNPVSQSLAQLELYGKNDKIEILAYDGDCVRIECSYDARNVEDYVQFHEGNGCISLLFDEKAMRSVGVICQVPRVHIGHIHAMTKNASVMLGGATADSIHLITKNANVYVESTKAKELVAESTNANIKAIGVSGGGILLKTTNAKVVVESITADSLSITTTNGSIKAEALDVADIRMKTTNSSLKLENLLAGQNSDFWNGERSLEAFTTNSGVRFNVPPGVGLSLDAKTTSSKVTCDIPLYASENTKTRLVGESVNYAASARRLRVVLGTTNASVKVREME